MEFKTKPYPWLSVTYHIAWVPKSGKEEVGRELGGLVSKLY